MKKITILLISLLFMTSCTQKETEKTPVSAEKELANINEYYIYGTHLNLNGDIEKPDNISIDAIKNVMLTLTDNNIENDIDYNLNYTVGEEAISFKLSNLKNGGIYLDELDANEYTMYIKIITKEKEYYYPVKNNTDYKKTEYYTMQIANQINKITIENNKDNIIIMKVKENKNNDKIYDLVIDAGHGGLDRGACYNGHCETDFTITMANKLINKLSEYGIKSKLTWDPDKIDKVSLVPTYGKGSRTASPTENYAKYLFSFHLNAGEWSGVEIYAPGEIDYRLARDIATNTATTAKTKYSNKNAFKVAPGVYNRKFKDFEIKDFAKEVKKEHKPYEKITASTEYYYLIRETGGYINGAYIDGRNKKIPANPYINNNIGTEAYIMEIGYISNKNELNNIKNNMDAYIDGIAKGIIDNVYTN